MTIDQTERDALGAEALPGGLADIQRALQPAPIEAADPMASRRQAGWDGVSDRRKKWPDVVA